MAEEGKKEDAEQEEIKLMYECANCSCGNMTAKQFAGLFSVCGAEDGISGRAETGEAGEEPPHQTLRKMLQTPCEWMHPHRNPSTPPKTCRLG